jgi:hypothetical protein
MTRPSTERPIQDLAQLHAEYVRKLHAAMGDDRPDLASELSRAFAEEADLAPATSSGSAPSAVRTRSRNLLRRLDRHTLETYNPSWPYRTRGPRTDR